MRAFMLAALALACVCSPAMAGAIGVSTSERLYAYAVPTSVIFALVCCSLIVLAHFRRRVPPPEARIWFIPLAFMLTMLVGPALAAEVATVGDTAVILPWGDYLVATAQMAVQIMLPVILPALAAAVLAAIGKVAPWATLFLRQRRLEQMGQALADYGLNAVQGAAKGKTLSVDVGSRVIAAGVNYGLEKVPPKVVEAAGGAEGLAKIIFRLVSFDDRATASAVIPAALEKLHLPSAVIEHPADPGRFTSTAPEELRDAERMIRG